MTRKWLALGVVTLAILLIGVDGTVLALATPFITEDLGATATQVLWIGDIYSFVLASLLITMGSLGDRIGHKKLLLCGATLFGLCPNTAIPSRGRGTCPVSGSRWSACWASSTPSKKARRKACMSISSPQV
jgi:MFS family permease